MFALPPHTTHVTQPLDRGCFSPLNMPWREVCHTFMAENPGKRVIRFNFSQLFSLAWMKSMTMKNIVSGFRVTGDNPINRKVVEKPKERSKPSLMEATGLAYIPLYSPAKVSSCVGTQRHTEFSPKELEKFQCRYENSYDLNTDKRYNSWLRMYHPDEYREQDRSTSFSDDQVIMSDCQKSDWQKLLTVPDPLPTKTLKRKQTARVLTGPEFLEQVREKELKKKEEAMKKEERRLAREKKAKDRAALLEKKTCEQESRKKKASTQQSSLNMSKAPKVTDSSILAELHLAPPFENSCTLSSPDYAFTSAQLSPTPSEIVRLASDIQNSTSLAQQAINAATDGGVQSPETSKKN